jgi:hypothetical protein
MSEMKNQKKLGLVAALKEAVRKGIVALKRNPQVIPMAMLVISFVIYSFNLTDMSDTTAKIQGTGMGLCQFCIMLFSLLSFVCLLNAFPRRKPANIPMLVLLFVMFGIMIFCDIHYCNGIMNALNRAESPIKLEASTIYIANAYNMLLNLRYLLGATAVLVATLPWYSKLLKKINTTVEVEDNGQMGAIEINE